jgi:helicase
MRMLGLFIGINKHADVGVRDLAGARKDATALWALFSDSVAGLDAKLLVDEHATAAAILQALDEVLGVAREDDMVVITFAGHGTHNHRLVAHDTSLPSLMATTIAMDDLAERLRRSKAKAILCVLDCCFSGGATARVLESSPVSRGAFAPVELLAGEGRVIVAASNVDEPAYELPGGQHGILTKALLDLLQSADGPVGVLASADDLMARVRAEAARIGVVQTSVVAGKVEGGLLLPPMRPGAKFFGAFPEAQGVRVTNDIRDLSAFGLPDAILAEWAGRFRGGINALQLAAINEHRVLDGASLLVVAPTSSGKTFVGELAATRAVLGGRKAVFLFPYRALVNEKYDQFLALYGEHLGMRVIRATGDRTDQATLFARGKYDIAVLTYEMFLSFLVSTPSVLNYVGLVVLDEAQFIADASRGIAVELLLTNLIVARERGVSPQLVALSAVIGELNSFDAWLGCNALVWAERPVPLVEGVLDRDGVYQYVDESGKEGVTQLIPGHEITQRRDTKGAQDVIVPLVRRLVRTGEQVIVFRNRRGPAEGCANYLAEDLGLPAAQEALNALPASDLSSSSQRLRSALRGGAAFHTSNLSREEREVIERSFRSPDGKIRVLAATTTVAAGINTPASTVILAEQEFVGEDGRPFTVAEYKNMAGRAGRLGYNEKGRSIILAEHAYERQTLFERYVKGRLGMLESSFRSDDLNTWVIRLLTQVKRLRRADVVHLLANTFGGYLSNLRSPKWQTEMEAELAGIVREMISLELIDDDGDEIQLSLLGHACGRSALSFKSALRLVRLLKQAAPSHLTAEGLVALMQVLPESDGGWTPLFKKGQKESARAREAADRYGDDVARALQRFADDDWDWYARCKRASILADWINGEPIEAIEQRYTTTPYAGAIGPGDVRRFADNTRFHLRSAQQLLSVLLVGQSPDEDAFDRMLKRLEEGLPSDALPLLELPLRLTRGEYLTLWRAGILSAGAVWDLGADGLDRLLGRTRALELLVAAGRSPAPIRA